MLDSTPICWEDITENHSKYLFIHKSPLQFGGETGRLQPFRISSRIFGSLPPAETWQDLWYPDNLYTTECVASSHATLYSLITYYLNRLSEWRLFFQKCKVCGRIFVAKNQKYELCSDKCRKKQAFQNNSEFDGKAGEDNYDLL